MGAGTAGGATHRAWYYPDMNTPVKVAQFVYLRRRNGRVVPLLITTVHSDDEVTGVVFDEKRSGLIAVEGKIKRGINEGQWSDSYDTLTAAVAIDYATARSTP